MSSTLDYVGMLCALRDLPFSVGKKLLFEYLRGKQSYESIQRNKLYKLESFGALGGYSENDLDDMLAGLVLNRLVEQVPLYNHKFVKVLQLTALGRVEIEQPSFHLKKTAGHYAFGQATVTEKERALFTAFDFFLSSFNDEQKKAITSPATRILCVAGAGSGKTTTLTKRIEFLIRYRSVSPSSILAVTFTRKARHEMAQRLTVAGIHGVAVETFNSFCEKILHRFSVLVYGKPVRVLTFSDRLRLFQQALHTTGYVLRDAVSLYYSSAQQRGKSDDELTFGFMNDCFSILDHAKTEGKQIQDFSQTQGLSFSEQRSARIVYKICILLQEALVHEGLRDYIDQLVDALRFFSEHPEHIPHYEHILVDEYQDVNELQVKLLDVLHAPHLFCVGDPRQSIFGWRGSQLHYILDFEKKYPGCEVIPLVKNYRSHKKIVHVVNSCLAPMRLPDIESVASDQGDVVLLSFDGEDAEYEFVLAKVAESVLPLHDVFVLARTNRQLKDISGRMILRGIPHVVRSDDIRSDHEVKLGHVLLATVHAVKGLEATLVFVVGCSGMYFPCKAGDHPIVDLVKDVCYDKEEEERRLLYVALSRAKKALYLTYSGTLTRFISPAMKELMGNGHASGAVKLSHSNSLPSSSVSVGISPVSDRPFSASTQSSSILGIPDGDTFERLKAWRRKVSQQLGVPAYVVFHDSTLLEIAMRKPSTLDELADVRGVGSAKLGRFGDEVLGLLK